MAFATTPGFSSANALAILKESYAEKEVQNLIERNSPTLARIKKVPGYGKYYVIPMMYSRGGAVAGDFTKMTALVSSTANNKAMQVTYGQAFSGFAIGPKEYLASGNDFDKGAFVQLIREYYFASTEALRKTIGGAIFGMGYGEVAPISAVDAGAKLFVTMSSFGAMMLDIGSKVQFATGPTPEGAYRAGGAVTVTKITDNGNDTVTVTFGSAYDAAVAVGDWAEIDGFRDSGGSPLLFVGLRGWLPTIGNRTGATWTGYIATSFFGVDRSTYPSRLAGQFILKDALEKYSEALVRGVRMARRAGAVPDMIVLNDVDFGTIIAEIKATQTQWQAINGPSAGSEMKAVSGLSSLMFAFSSTWVQYVVDDPYCPVGFGYVLETESVGIAMLSNKKPIDTEVPMTNEGGSPKISSQDTPPLEYRWNIDDLLATAPSDTVDGQGARVTTQFFGAFFVRNPAHCCVVKFDSTIAA